MINNKVKTAMSLLLTAALTVVPVCAQTVQARELNAQPQVMAKTVRDIDELQPQMAAYEGWEKTDGKWRYHKRDGSYATGWLSKGRTWYYFNNEGIMQTGWQKVNGKWYYMEASGAMKTGWLKGGGKWYYLNPSGDMATGWKKVNDKWYYLESSGAMKTGWLDDGGERYYLEESGAMATGWKYLPNPYYPENGRTPVMLWYYFKPSGAMATGWQKVSGDWYYLDSSDNEYWAGKGGMLRGFYVDTDGKIYYLDKESGKMYTGHHDFSGNDYWFAESGELLDEDGNPIYYLN